MSSIGFTVSCGVRFDPWSDNLHGEGAVQVQQFINFRPELPIDLIPRTQGGLDGILPLSSTYLNGLTGIVCTKASLQFNA